MPPRSPPAYRRLTRARAGLGSYTSLWLAEDHLLQVNSTGYSESYRRFYFRDIQAIFLVRTDRRSYWTVCWSLLFGIALVIALGNQASGVVELVILALGVGAVLGNHLLGPACHGLIVTAVKAERVPPLARMPTARKVLRRIRPLIEAAQAGIGPPAAAAEIPAAESPKGPA